MAHLRRRPTGITMIELMVSSALLAFVFLGALEFMAIGARYYRNADFSLDLQRNTLVAMSFLSRDIGETNSKSTYVNSYAPDPIGFMVASPRNAQGSLVFGTSGRLVWSSMICYYYDQPNSALVRTQVYLTGSTTPRAYTVPPTVGPGTSSDAPPGFDATTSDFANQTGLIPGLPPYQSHIVARYVKSFSLQSSAAKIGISMTAGTVDSATAGSHAYEVTVNTTVFCKN